MRSAAPGWRDPRLWVGVAIVAASILLGARVVGSADQTVAVWAVSSDAAAGTEVTAADLKTVRIHFDGADQAALYLSADQALPPGARLSRDVSRGELLPRSALETTDTSDLAELPLDFLDSGVAATLRRGDRVDVFVTSPSSDAASAELSLTDVVVLDVIRGSSALGSAGGVQVILGVTDQDRSRLPHVVQAAGAGRVYLVARG